MSSEHTESPAAKSQEVRIGLVMYGGVSLAVYINGVTQEFYHAVQGNGVYRLIKELTDSEIVLDIVSGSSAGGINGILLSYALCNGKDFTHSADLWRNAADIRRLLRSTANGDAPARSLLDSEGYYQSELESAFRTLDSLPARAEAPSPVKELDLFITGTDIDGRTQQHVDDAGHVIEGKDHRAVFHLKYRKDRKSNFDSSSNPAVPIALSKLARITSCFPGAFAPVFVPHSEIRDKDPQRMSANELLQYWGGLPGPAYFVDGGVIDNKPFTHTIREIFFRTAERKVDRRLFYVEPDPERYSAPDAENTSPESPSFLKPIVNSLVTIPGFESITDDLKLLSTHNEDIREYHRILRDVAFASDNAPAKRWGVDVPDVPEPQRSIYARTRFASISSRAIEGVFRNGTSRNSARLSAQRAELIREFDRRTAEAQDTLRDFDILFRLRRTFHVVDFIYGLLYHSEDAAPLSQDRIDAYRAMLRQLNGHLELLNVLDSSTMHLLEEVDYGWDDARDNPAAGVWDRVVWSLHQLLHAEGLTTHLDDLTVLNSALRRRIRHAQANVFEVPRFRSVLRACDEHEEALLRNTLSDSDPVFRRYFSFNEIDAYLFPMEWMSGLREKDVINVCRISPVDAQRGFSRRPANQKTAGDTLAHFSAFFKRTWRSNDILWGRLDTACELTETLLTRQRLREAMDNADARRRARAALAPEGSPSPMEEWFKDSSEAAVARLLRWVRDMTDDDPVRRRLAIDEFLPEDSTGEGSIRELLIEMAQFRILHECLPQVFEDSIREQAEWKHTRKRSEADPQKLEWLGGDVSVDGAVLQALASSGGRKMLDELGGGRPVEESPVNSRLGRSFAEFRIGSEELLDGAVPPLILADTASRALLVLRNCLIGSLDASAANRVRAGAFYRWGIDLPLRVLRGGVTLMQSSTGLKTGLLAGATAFSILALLVGLTQREVIVRPGGNFSIVLFVVFVAGPAAFLFAEIYQFAGRGANRLRLSSRVGNALVAICAASPVISVILVYFGLTDLVWDWWNGTSEPVESRNIQAWMLLLYGIVPFILSFLGGYMAVRRNNRAPEPDDYAAVLERMTEAELQDISDRMGEKHAVTPEKRRDVIKALTVSAETNDDLGRLDRAIRAASPGALE